MSYEHTTIDAHALHSQSALKKGKIWFAASYGSLGLLMPYFYVLLTHMGCTGWQLGVVSGMRPFISAICGPLWAGLADHWQLHRLIFLMSCVISFLARASLGVLYQPFWYLLVVVALMEAFSGPVSIMADTAIVAAALDSGDYGRCRVWACLCWGISGSTAGLLMHFYGDGIVFAAYAVLACVAFGTACTLDYSFVAARAPPRQLSPSPSTHLGSLEEDPAGDAAALPRRHTLCPTSIAVGIPDGEPPLLGSSLDALWNRAANLWGPASPPPCLGSSPGCPPSDGGLQQPLLTADAGDAESAQGGRLGARSATPDSMLSPRDSSASVLPTSMDARISVSMIHGDRSRGPEARGGAGRDASEPLLPSQRGGMDPELGPFRERLWALMTGSMVVFLAKAFFMGVCVGVIDGYLFVYLASLGGTPILMGACLAAICCIELPIFMHSGPILRLLGYQGSLHLALGAFCLRLAFYAILDLVPSLWLIVPVELLHGVTFGIAWSAGINYCKQAAPPGLAATAQGLFSSTYFGVGRGTGGLVGGLLFDLYGPAVLFRAACAWTTVAWLILSIVERCLRSRVTLTADQ